MKLLLSAGSLATTVSPLPPEKEKASPHRPFSKRTAGARAVILPGEVESVAVAWPPTYQAAAGAVERVVLPPRAGRRGGSVGPDGDEGKAGRTKPIPRAHGSLLVQEGIRRAY